LASIRPAPGKTPEREGKLPVFDRRKRRRKLGNRKRGGEQMAAWRASGGSQKAYGEQHGL
jgi:hypothetical protein